MSEEERAKYTAIADNDKPRFVRETEAFEVRVRTSMKIYKIYTSETEHMRV